MKPRLALVHGRRKRRLTPGICPNCARAVVLDLDKAKQSCKWCANSWAMSDFPADAIRAVSG